MARKKTDASNYRNIGTLDDDLIKEYTRSNSMDKLNVVKKSGLRCNDNEKMLVVQQDNPQKGWKSGDVLCFKALK